MELQELVYFYILEESRTIEVSFRLTTDGEDELRTDFIESLARGRPQATIQTKF